MSQRSVCNQFTPQLWRATKCKFCFNDKESHEKASKVHTNNPASKENITSVHTNNPTILSPKIKRLSSSFIKRDENMPRSPTRRNTGSNSDESPSILSSDSDSVKNRPTRIKLLSQEDKTPQNLPITSPIENINFRLEMNKQLIAKDDKIHNLEVRNQNLENEIRTLKDQNAALAKTQQSEEEHRKMLDKIASLRRKLSDMEVKNAKLKEEKQNVEETLKQEEQVVSKLKIRINSMEHEHYLLELRVEREQKHKQSVTQEKEEAEQELECLRKAYRSIQRESRRLSTTFDVDEERARELEDQLRQTQRRLGMVEVENNRLKDKISKVESDRQDNQITQLERQLLSAKENFDESQMELEELRSSHLSEIQSLQTQISRLQIENDELHEGYTKKNLELSQIKRTLSDVDATRHEAISKDEELVSLRAEVARLQDKCSALCDVELIHINLNKELDRHRDRADQAELQVRQLQREVLSERELRERCGTELEQLRAKEEECRQKHRVAHNTAPPIRARASSLETSRFTKPAPPPNRRRPSRDHLQQRARDSDV
ncbi:myosin heavy chain, clone 203-like isoform X2 [Bolinopsis microptera]|uniref:myosin heavy chain, clone 203-like isoform X2 n=1 Tax=Bolinopsis microptera TaxID=2820187 RepID=UPI00307AFA15